MHLIHRLKIDLMTHGIEVPRVTREVLAGLHTARPLTLADYASTSGVSLELEGGVYVNAPLQEHNPNFVSAPVARLEPAERGGGFVVRSRDLVVPARPIPVPDYHKELSSTGEPYTTFAITHTDRVRISPIEGCAYRCTFCDIPTTFQYRRKSIQGLVESVARAERDATLPARHMLISGGTPRAEDYTYLREVYETVARRFAHMPVDVMMVPDPDFMDLDWLNAIGINALSINLELYSDEAARRYMPNKRALGRAHDDVFRAWYGDFIERAAGIFGPGRVRSLLMVGLEPAEATLAGVAFLAERGCQPVLSPFRPAPGTRLEKMSPPTTEFLAEIYLRARDIAERRGVRLGPSCLPCQHNTLTFPDDAETCSCRHAA